MLSGRTLVKIALSRISPRGVTLSGSSKSYRAQKRVVHKLAKPRMSPYALEVDNLVFVVRPNHPDLTKN